MLKEFASLFLFKPLPFHNVVKKLTTAGILHNQKELPVRLYDLIQLDYVWMPHNLENLNLSGHSFNICLI